MNVLAKLVLKILGLTVFLLIFSPLAQARSAPLSRNELLFVAGYAAAMKNDIGNCADLMFMATEEPSEISNRARLYLAKCQLDLKSRSNAALNIKAVDSSKLNSQRKNMYETLHATLSPELDQMEQAYFTLVPYGGALSYGGDETSRSGGQFFRARA